MVESTLREDVTKLLKEALAKDSPFNKEAFRIDIRNEDEKLIFVMSPNDKLFDVRKTLYMDSINSRISEFCKSSALTLPILLERQESGVYKWQLESDNLPEVKLGLENLPLAVERER